MLGLQGFPRKALSLALAAVMLATTLAVAPMPGWVPVVGDSTESASAHPGYWKTVGGYWEPVPRTRLTSRCVQHEIDYATDTWVCARTQSSWETYTVSVWVPPTTYWYHGSHVNRCNKWLHVGWAGANLVAGLIPGGQVVAAPSAGAQIGVMVSC